MYRFEFLQESKVVVRISKKFARGFDLKLKKAAYVIGLIYDVKLVTENLIEQMLGRGCREQGVPEGKMIFCHDRDVT